MNSLTAIELPDGGLIYKRGEIFGKYLKTWFFIDLFSSFPFYLLTFGRAFSLTNKILKFTKIPKILQLLRMLKLTKIKKIVFEKNFFKEIRHSFVLKRLFIDLLKEIYWFVFWLHLISCFWYLIVQFEDTNDLNNNWVSVYNLDNTDIFTKYVSSLYFILTIMVTVGYGNITPSSINEKIVVIFLIFFGIASYGILISAFLGIFSKMRDNYRDFFETVNFIDDLARLFKLPYCISERLAFSHSKSQKSQKITIFEKYMSEGFFNDFPENYLGQVIGVIFRKDIENSEFLRGKPSSFLSSFFKKTQSANYLQDEEIYSEGDPSDFIYFLLEGRVSQFFFNENDEKMYYITVKGSYFGESEYLNSQFRKESAVSMGDSTRLLRIKNRDFWEILEDYEKIKMEVLENVAKKLKKTGIKKEIIIENPFLIPMNYWRWKHEENRRKIPFEEILISKSSHVLEKFGKTYYSENFKVLAKEIVAKEFISQEKGKIIRLDEKKIEKIARKKVEKIFQGESEMNK